MSKKHSAPSAQEATIPEPAVKLDTGIIRANLNRRVTPSPTFVSLYANDVQVQTTPWDIRLVFGEIGDASEDGSGVDVRRLGEVRLSLPLTKKLTLILVQQLQAYEERIGQISMPAD
jgi:hypothetical protein